MERQPSEVKGLVKGVRWLLLLSWGVYPIAYLLPALGIAGASATVGIQVGYTIADVLAKPIFGLYIFAIANAKTKADQVADVDGVSATQPLLESVESN